jgi:uncharacterized protein (TIGR02246 family)
MQVETMAHIDERERAAIMQSVDSYRDAVLQRDFERIAAHYTEDALLLPPHAPAIRGREAIRDWAASLPPVRDVRFLVEDIDGHGDFAYIVLRYEMMMDAGGDEQMHDRGKSIEIRRRTPAGEWLVHRDTFNSDLPER